MKSSVSSAVRPCHLHSMELFGSGSVPRWAQILPTMHQSPALPGGTHAVSIASGAGTRNSRCNGLQLDQHSALDPADALGRSCVVAGVIKHCRDSGYPARSSAATGTLSRLDAGDPTGSSGPCAQLRQYREHGTCRQLDTVSPGQGPESGAGPGHGWAARRSRGAPASLQCSTRDADQRELRHESTKSYPTLMNFLRFVGRPTASPTRCRARR